MSQSIYLRATMRKQSGFNFFQFLFFAVVMSLFILQASAEICSTNNYALCSHANCECLNENGESGSCESYDFSNPGSNSGWARCTCPIVKNMLGDIAYNTNFATLDCDTLDHPQESENGNPFPNFTYLKGKKAEVYSTYSYGDSLDSHKFGTLKNASLMICDSPDLMTLCLDMPCTVGENGDVAECYCQNASLKPDKGCQADGSCQLTVWNTLGGECKQANCNPGSNHVWSAAYIPQTLEGINDLYNDIASIKPGFADLASYCANN